MRNQAKWHTIDGSWVDNHGNVVINEHGEKVHVLSPTAKRLLAVLREKGRVCSLDMTVGEKVCAARHLVKRGLIKIIPSPDECSPGTVVYYVELPSTVTQWGVDDLRDLDADLRDEE